MPDAALTSWHQTENTTLYVGDVTTVLAYLPAGSVNCIVTSPPYYATRDWDDARQIGQEPTPAAYLHALREVFREAHRVLAEDGALWLNIADVYATGPAPRRTVTPGHSPLPPKSLLGLPWRLALALQEDGWILRNEIIWAKPNAVPESCRDRLARRHELLYLLTKNSRYHFDLDAIRQRYDGDRSLVRRAHRSANKPNTARGIWPRPAPRPSTALGRPNIQPSGVQHTASHPGGRNPGTVWTIPTRPSRHAHTAPYPIDLARRCISAGCPPGGMVLDPFSGSGTTLAAALQLDRQAIGIDIREDFQRLARARLEWAAALS
ncbi:DNA-methyltransferase [Streptomyces sp. NPDC002851]